MESYEKQYIDNLQRILYSGSSSLNKRTGICTLRVPYSQIIVDLEKEFPILLSKKVNWKVAVKEILWIMQRQSCITADLGAKIWDSWTGEDGTIGKAYGYQAAKPVYRKDNNGQVTSYKNQVEYVLETLKNDPSNRQCVIDLWNVDDLQYMNLVPCCYSSVWSIIDDHLNCMLVQRSADYPIGVPFDTTQYAALTCMFARHLNVRPGILTHVMADSHIYESQIPGVCTQLKQFAFLCTVQNEIPRFCIREGVENFWDMTLDDFSVEPYSPMPAINFGKVAV